MKRAVVGLVRLLVDLFYRRVALWRIPILRGILDLLGCVPVVRKGEGEREISSKGEERNPPLRLARAFRNRQLLLTARKVLKRVEPCAVASVARGARALDHLLRKISLSPSALDNPPPARMILWNTLKAALFVLLGFPVAVLGVAAWYVPYRVCGVIANRVRGASEQRDQIALYKLLAGVVLFPTTHAAWTAAAWALGGAAWGALVFVVLPIAGILSLLFLEHAAWRERQARELLALAFMPGGIARLRATRDALVAECDRLAGVFRRASDNRPA